MGVTSGRVNTNKVSKTTFYVEWQQTGQSTENNQTTINWQAGINTGTSTSHDDYYNNAVKIYDIYINGVKVYAGGTWSQIHVGNDKQLTSGTATIPHNNDGSKSFDISISAWTYSSSNYSGSGTFTLNDIPRQAKVSTFANFNDESNPILTYSNSAGNVVSSLQSCIASSDGGTIYVPYRDISKTGTSYTFELTDSERTTLRNATPNNSNLGVRVYIKTILNGVTYYDYKDSTMSIINANPFIEIIDYSDVNSATSDFTHNDHVIIQGLSRLQFQFYDVEALKGATLSKLYININGNVVQTPFTGTSIATATYNYNEVDVSENTTAVLTLEDSRGLQTSYNVPLTIWEYDTPTAMITTYRENNFYTESHIKVDANYSSLNDLNTITIKYRIKKTTENTWGNWTTISDNVVADFNADNQYAWDIQVELEDAVGGYQPYIINNALDVGIPIVFYDVEKRSVGINCFPTHDGEVEVNGLTLLDMAHPVGSVITIDSNTNPSSTLGGTWVQVPCHDLIEEGTFSDGTTSATGRYRIYANGDFEIMAQCGYFNLNAQSSKTYTLTFPYTMTRCYCNISIMYGGGNFANCNSYCYANGTSIYTYTWNNGGATANDIALAIQGYGMLDLATNNIDTLYSFRRVS